MMDELHLTKKDFSVEWFSGTGPGGQHRNKTQNCCRIRHNATGLVAQSTKHRERSSNQRDAFNRLAAKILAFYNPESNDRNSSSLVVRTYHFERNVATDGTIERPVGEVVDGDIDIFLKNALTGGRQENYSGRG
jgi:protein subunit release factor B